MNTAHIYETQKATLVLLKVAFRMLNDAEGFELNRILTSHCLLELNR